MKSFLHFTDHATKCSPTCLVGSGSNARRNEKSDSRRFSEKPILSKKDGSPWSRYTAQTISNM